MPWEMVVTRPLQMNWVASVVIQELSLNLEVSRPLIAPISAPLARPISMHTIRPSAFDPHTVYSPQRSQATPIMMPAKQPFMPTDRSTSPVSVTSAWPSAIMPMGMELIRILEKNFQVRNTGFALLVSTQMRMMGISMPISGVRINRTNLTSVLLFRFAAEGVEPLRLSALFIFMHLACVTESF